jgi:hypothetical protein
MSLSGGEKAVASTYMYRAPSSVHGRIAQWLPRQQLLVSVMC